jgi:hypothetical protein
VSICRNAIVLSAVLLILIHSNMILLSVILQNIVLLNVIAPSVVHANVVSLKVAAPTPDRLTHFQRKYKGRWRRVAPFSFHRTSTGNDKRFFRELKQFFCKKTKNKKVPIFRQKSSPYLNSKLKDRLHDDEGKII